MCAVEVNEGWGQLSHRLLSGVHSIFNRSTTLGPDSGIPSPSSAVVNLSMSDSATKEHRTRLASLKVAARDRDKGGFATGKRGRLTAKREWFC